MDLTVDSIVSIIGKLLIVASFTYREEYPPVPDAEVPGHVDTPIKDFEVDLQSGVLIFDGDILPDQQLVLEWLSTQIAASPVHRLEPILHDHEVIEHEAESISIPIVDFQKREPDSNFVVGWEVGVGARKVVLAHEEGCWLRSGSCVPCRQNAH